MSGPQSHYQSSIRLSQKRIHLQALISLTILSIVFFLLVPGQNLPRTIAHREPDQVEQDQVASSRGSVSMRGAGRDELNKLSAGHEARAVYAGPEDLRVALQQNLAEPLSLASADFDEDGVPDLISGYSYNGRGIISFLRGNVDSIYPNAPEAQQHKADGTFSDAPFLSPAQLFETPVSADFVGTGDFDADGHWDVVVAARKARALYLLSGDGRGGLELTLEVSLDGVVTAMTVGEINRPDGLNDIVIGKRGPGGSQVLVFEGPAGALRAKPERFRTPAAPTAFALGQFEGPSENELVIAAGRDLIMIYGRDRKLSLNESEQSKVAPATIARSTMPYLINGLAAGNFFWDQAHQTDLALLAPDGQVHFLSVDTEAKAVNSRQSKTYQDKLAWVERSALSLAPTSSPSSLQLTKFEGARALVAARVSAHQTDDLLLMEIGQQPIQVVNADPAQRDETGHLLEAGASTEATASVLNAETAPVAVLPMRLNGAASSSLVMLRSGQAAPTVLATAPSAIITVNSSDDTNIRNNVLTLREAILLANGGTSAAGGLSKAELTPLEQAQVQGTPSANQLDEIRFNIPAIGQTGANTAASAMSVLKEFQASESHQLQQDRSSPIHFAEYAQSKLQTATGRSFKSSFANSSSVDFESSTDVSWRAPAETWPQSSKVSLNSPPTPARHIQLSPISNRTESADLELSVPIKAERSGLTTPVQFTLNDSATFSCTTPSLGPPGAIRLGTGGTYPFAVAVADFNGDGKQDVVTANQSSYSITVRLGDGAGGLGAPATFELGPGAGGQVSVAIGDFNRDGKPDVVLGNNTNNINVLLGNGAGGFGPPNAFSLSAGVTSTSAVAVGDFNGDGTPDVVTANSANNITVLLGNGAGGFGTPNLISLGANVSSANFVAVSDFNQDGKLDAVTANKSHNITVLLGNGAGGFASPNTLDLAANEPQSVAIGDFNRDGRQDLVTANVNSTSVTLLLGNIAGSFGSPSTFSLGAAANSPSSTSIGDFNADGKLDVVTANFNSNNMTRLLGNGTGGFETPETFTLGVGTNFPYSLAVGDFNSDGKPDVVTANVYSNNLTMLVANNFGGFDPPKTFDLSTGGNGPLSIAIGDFNGDGKRDVAIANQNSNNVSVASGNGGGGFGPPNTFNLGAGVVNPNSIAIADFNGDGRPDVITANITSKDVTVLPGNAAGGFGSPATFSLGAGVTDPYSVTTGDFNRDGRLDVVTANVSSDNFTLLLGDGGGGFGLPSTFNVAADAHGPYAVATGDFSGDGTPDVVTANINSDNVTLAVANGNGGFGPPMTFALGAGASHPNALAVGDFNRDSRLDVVTVNFVSNNITVLLNIGSAGFGAPNTLALGGATPSIDLCCSGRSVAIGDFNGDGNQDVVAATRWSNLTTVLLGNGVGGFGPANIFRLGAGVSEPYSVAVGDLNGDDKPDLVTGNLGSNNLVVLLNTCGTSGVAPDLTLSKSHTGNFTVGMQGSIRLGVTNVGGSSTTSATIITDDLPNGLSFAGVAESSSDTGWNCTSSGQTVTCTNSLLLLPQTTTTVGLIVNVAQSAAPKVTNTAMVATAGDAGVANNTASDVTLVGVACASQAINIGQTINGQLSTADCYSPLNPNSPFADRYTFMGVAGQPITIELSAAFDTFLYLIGPEGSVIGSDDDGGGGTNSRILAGSGFFILPASGTYTIEATSARTNETGNYTLSLTTGIPGCTYSVAPTSQAFSGAGGSGTVNVTTPNNCPWTAVSNSNFITINSGANGTGNGAVGFTVAVNSTTSTRTGTLTIAGQIFTVTQAAGAVCVYSINPTSQSFPAVGGSGSVAVVTPNGCAWTATSNAAFIIVNGGSGSDNGIASFTVTANTSFTTRIGTLTIAGKTFTVVQAGAAANTFTINLVSPLPKISDSVIIDGATQPGFSGRPLIAINGSGLSSVGGGNGLVITAGSSTLRSLTITGFASQNRDAAVVLITNGGNVVEGCYFGTDVSGARSSGQVGGPVPLAAGISVRSSSNNRIGGTTVAARNIISGVDGVGVVLTGGSQDNLIQGNYIGTDVTGSLSLDFQRIGVYIQGSNHNTIGGQTATLGAPPGNLISGNIDYGVFLQDDSFNNLVVGNIIGANGSGTNAVPNGNAGVFIYNPQGASSLTLNNTIGGMTTTARNVISGNSPYGIVLGQGATGTQIQGNFIGTNVTGTAALPNAYGITATQATGSTIGGAIDATRNVISGNSLTGVSIGFLNNGQVGGTGTTIQRNYIGTNATGAGALGNQADGVFVEVQSITHTIQDNLIAFNGSNGVRIPDVTSNPGAPGFKIQIVDNSVFSNAGLGIDLGAPGITANDPGDADAGANLLQNFPVLTSFIAGAVKQSDAAARLRNPAMTGASAAAATATVSGTLNSTPNSSFTVHWYLSAGSQCVTNQAASQVLNKGKIPGVNTDNNGNAFFTIPLEFPVGIDTGVVNCTATDSLGNTSEYSACLSVNAATPQWQPVVLTAQQITEMKAWTVGGRTSVYVKPQFPDAGYRVINWGQATRAGNDFTADASVEKFTGASVQSVVTTAQIYDLGPLSDGTYNFNFKTSGTLAKTLQFTVSSTVPPANPIDDARQFVKQQYRDFLNREADQAGEDFWTDNITKCMDPARRPPGQTAEQCTLRQRETTSGAFFRSPEFQYTSYFVYRMYQGALGRQPKLSEFIPDAQFVGNGIVVNGQLSGAVINQNKAAFAAQFVNCTDTTKYRCAEFKSIYDALNNQQFVDKLFQTTGVNASASDRAGLVNALSANPATETRASVLQKVVDGINVIAEGSQQFTTTYGQAFYNAELNRAFVQLEYFGYMRRDPDESGYAFWLNKLNTFDGDFVAAEMVLAFISSPEYRARFGQP